MACQLFNNYGENLCVRFFRIRIHFDEVYSYILGLHVLWVEPSKSIEDMAFVRFSKLVGGHDYFFSKLAPLL